GGRALRRNNITRAIGTQTRREYMPTQKSMLSSISPRFKHISRPISNYCGMVNTPTPKSHSPLQSRRRKSCAKKRSSTDLYSRARQRCYFFPKCDLQNRCTTMAKSVRDFPRARMVTAVYHHGAVIPPTRVHFSFKAADLHSIWGSIHFMHSQAFSVL